MNGLHNYIRISPLHRLLGIIHPDLNISTLGYCTGRTPSSRGLCDGRPKGFGLTGTDAETFAGYEK